MSKGPSPVVVGLLALVAAAALLAVILATPATALLPAVEDPQPQRAALDVSGWDDESVTVPGASLSAEDIEGTGIGPGSMLLVDIDDSALLCTAAYVFESRNTTYLGAAGHCFLAEGTSATHGPGADFDPDRATVRVCASGCFLGGQSGAELGTINGTFVDLGPVAYARQHASDDEEDQVGHDFGLVEIPADAQHLIRHTMPVFGGVPAEGMMEAGETSCHFGNGVVLGEATRARTGVAVSQDDSAGTWHALHPGAPGDSGSAMNVCGPSLDSTEAVGVLTHIAAGFPTTGIVGTTIARGEQMAQEDAGLSVQVSLG